ncbi:MAG: glutamine amidotransferase [Kiritimatiellae bacterium]|nr:glutamine amidotransferase [Kiritimatiellia bacterium]
MKALIIHVGLAVGLMTLSARAAEPTLGSSTSTQGGRTLVTISNAYEELTFEPARGGRCVSFRFLDNGEQLIASDDASGMFLDHWAKYAYPSGLMHLPYHYEVVKEADRRIGLKEWVTVPAKGGGAGNADRVASMAKATSPDLIGLVVKKTIWLNVDSDCIEVVHEIGNPTQDSRGVSLYVQHNLVLNGNRRNDVWCLPSERGILYQIQPTDANDSQYGSDWILEPTAGWMAVRDQKTKRGMVFTFDYNYLQKIYTCGFTAEWFMETMPVAPGKSFRTTSMIKPVKDFEDFVFASSNLVADIRGHEQGDAVEIALDLAAVSRPLREVTLKVTATSWSDKKTLGTETLTLDRLGYEKIRRVFRIHPKAVAEGVVVRVKASGPGFEDAFEHYYAGDKFEYERRYGWFANKGGALAGSSADAYALKPPPKVKSFDKPDFANVARPAPGRFKCLVVFGLYTHILNLDDALAGWKSAGGASPEFTWANCPPNAIESFPGSYEELFGYDVVILSDVNFKAIGGTGFEMLCDYVREGGRLLVTGGPYALGNGEYEGTRVPEMLPVTLSGPFDLKWSGKGKAWNLEPAREGDSLLRGISFENHPKVFWRHLVTPKAGASVVLKAGGQPALVLGVYGKGTVAVLTLSPTGEPGQGETAWWEWDGWSTLMKNLMTELTEGVR